MIVAGAGAAAGIGFAFWRNAKQFPGPPFHLAGEGKCETHSPRGIVPSTAKTNAAPGFSTRRAPVPEEEPTPCLLVPIQKQRRDGVKVFDEPQNKPVDEKDRGGSATSKSTRAQWFLRPARNLSFAQGKGISKLERIDQARRREQNAGRKEKPPEEEMSFAAHALRRLTARISKFVRRLGSLLGPDGLVPRQVPQKVARTNSWGAGGASYSADPGIPSHGDCRTRCKSRKGAKSCSRAAATTSSIR